MNGIRPRTLAGVAFTMSWQPLGSDGETATADPGTVTVGVTRSDGTDVVAAGTATGGSLLLPRTIAITAAQAATVDILTATWKVGATTVATTSVDVVGGYFYTNANLRLAQPTLADTTKDTAAQLLSVRDEVETFFEDQLGIACVPRLSVVDVRNSGSLLLTGLYFVRTVRWAHLWTSNTTYTSLDATDLAEIAASESGLLSRTGNWAGRVTAGIEHGLDAPPVDVVTAAMRYARVVANRKRAGTVERAQLAIDPSGFAVGPRAAGTDQKPTGYEDIDEVLRRPGLYHPQIAAA